jgi:hypothetical protein
MSEQVNKAIQLLTNYSEAVKGLNELVGLYDMGNISLQCDVEPLLKYAKDNQLEYTTEPFGKGIETNYVGKLIVKLDNYVLYAVYSTYESASSCLPNYGATEVWTIDRILNISVEDEEWAEAASAHYNECIKYIDPEKLHDFACTANQVNNIDDKEIADIIYTDYEPRHLFGMATEDILSDCIDPIALHSYIKDKNDEYCRKHGLCTKCRSQLVDGECIVCCC